MKKIINGKIYNTETAEEIANEGKSLHNFYSTTETLYRTKSGAWFIHGESSAGGTYSEWYGNSCGYGQDIIAMNNARVLKWAENADIGDKDKTRIAELLELPEA